ncbi:MAG: vanillate O-demethylase oxidoreductase VanB [Chloroflexi bacterium]|nr:MAG: vanillate O-demethylase oxidoreductase VanB [Chloroflexota bacterium]
MAVKTQAPNETSSTDRIEKRVVLRAPRTPVWRALTSAEEFGTWFRVKLDGGFTEGRSVRGRLTIPGYEHVTLEMLVERIDPERYFSYRWHPYAVDPAVDYAAEPTTLVEFRLEDTEGGTALTIVESGFDRIPLARRAEAFRMNDNGWDGQIKQLARYVA